MAVFFCADLHLTHRNIHNFRRFKDPIGSSGKLFHWRKFNSVEEHDDYVDMKWRSVIRSTKRDVAYVAGDIAFSKEGWERFDALPGKKIVILGNHCTEYATAEYIAGLKTVNSVHSMLRYKSAVITHAPMHPEFLRGKRNIHGHLHSDIVQDRRYMNVSLEQLDYTPIKLEDLFAEFDRRQDLAYVYKTLGLKAAMRMMIQTCRNIRK